MTDQEKRALARWLAERLEPEPSLETMSSVSGGRLVVKSCGGLWERGCTQGDDDWRTAPLDGNFAAAVIKIVQKKWCFEIFVGDSDEVIFVGDSDEVRVYVGNAYARHEEFEVAVCLAVKDLLEGDAEWPSQGS